ncbi:hypothetical protein PLESTB_000661400 [Pleodorina starrii]|uniref:Uncharacterized protein n=1 Tax=Pleodorina starrii TaxID=330485 RepID=A0A9W6F206_9CHLO|nr:hypothetical protein PLESTM_001319200 [Pleodorina starrii]GLC52726.1 hypothetical protein PLESTB_000661400 [Pleodorina starrii]
MRQRLGVACESPNSFLGQLHPLRTPSAAPSLTRALPFSNPRGPVGNCATNSSHTRTVDNDSRPSATPGDAPAKHLFHGNVANNAVMAAPAARGQISPADARSTAMTAFTTTTIAAAAPDGPALLEDLLLEHIHRAPAGMADRIAAASERHENRQRRNGHLGASQPGSPKPTQQKSPQVLPHDPESSRFWEARLLSRACQSLAFHISSHFHVPAAHADPLSSVLNTTPATPLAPTITATAGSLVSSSTGFGPSPPVTAAGTAATTSLLPPPLSPLPAGGFGADPASQHGDLYGMYDNLPAVYALKAVAGALVDPALWRAPSPALPPSTSTSPLQPIQGPHSEAPSAVNALVHVVADALLRLAHACGHSGCYNLAGPPPPPRSPGGGGGGATAAAAATAGCPAPPLVGVSFATGRQRTRLYDMACSAGDVDVGALASVPGSAAAAMLVLLAAAQPPRHPAVAAAMAAAALPPGNAAATSGGGGGPPTIPAALLARYLRVGSRSHNPLDTVRVMWALLRLQLPGAGSLLLPMQPGGDGDGGDVEDSGSGAAAVSPPSDPMTQLAAVLSRQLRNRDRALGALRAAPPGELCGTWQLAVQTLVLLRDRAAAAERSAAALAQLDSALALLEATLTGSSSSGSEIRSGSAPESGSGSGSGSTSPAHASSRNGAGDGRRRRACGEEARAGDGDGGEAPAVDSGGVAVEALQAFLELCGEVAAARGAAAAAAGPAAPAAAPAAAAASAAAGSFLAAAAPAAAPAWDVLPRSDAEWRAVLEDTEQRAALLMSTWPELRRLVETREPTEPPSPYGAGVQQQLQLQQQQQQLQQQQLQGGAQAAAAEGRGRQGAAVAEEPGEGGSENAASAAAVSSGPTDCAAVAEPAVAAHQRRRLRLHLQSYSAMHFRTLELLYRAVKAQAPDATLLAPLSAPEAAAAAAAAASAGSTATAIPAAAAGTSAAAAAAASQRILDAVALPYSASVDMVFTDARGRRVGLCLAHLGASRRAPGELAVLQYALRGWPEADAAAAQQGFRAARAVAAAAAASAKARAAQTAAAAAAAATAFAVVGAAAAAAAAATAGDATTGPWNGAAAAAAASSDSAAAALRTAPPAHASSRQHDGGRGGADAGAYDNGDVLGSAECTLVEATAAALEADAAAVAAAPGVAAAAAAEAADAAAAVVGPPPSGPDGNPGHSHQIQDLDLDDIVVLELDHDWFHLRESYYGHVRQQGKWDEGVRQAIGGAMSYTELPWEAQLDMAWHSLAGAGVELPIRVFA